MQKCTIYISFKQHISCLTEYKLETLRQLTRTIIAECKMFLSLRVIVMLRLRESNLTTIPKCTCIHVYVYEFRNQTLQYNTGVAIIYVIMQCKGRCFKQVYSIQF